MKIKPHQNLIHKIRQKTPLSLRQKIGPVLAYIIYTFNLYLRKNRKRPHVLSISDTIDLILKEKLSVIRFGDGEIFMLDGGDIGFQKRQGDLAERLEMIMRAKHKGLLICVPGVWESLDTLEPFAYWFNMHHLYRHGHVWKSLLSYDQTYGDTNITRPYLAYKDKPNAGSLFKKLFSIWEDANVILVEGAQSRLGLGNDMFAKAKSVARILCPPENAYSKYEIIKKEALKLSKDKLILLSLGPAAKVLAYDLFNLGYRVIDVGHVDMEYEMFLRKLPKLTKIANKYVNELNERTPEDCTDPAYLSQIITTIK